MRLYHGSNIEIKSVDLKKCRPYKDFGQGFYLTTLKQQALRMAKRVSRIYGGMPIITVYEFAEKALDAEGIKVKLFESVNEEWAMFVINNRNRRFSSISSLECNLDKKYDIVIGPIADDDLALLFRQFSNGWIGVDALVKGMEYKELTDQYSFHTERALQYLEKVGVING